MSNADENHRLQSRRAEFFGNFLRQFDHFIAETACAECAEVGEVFAQLRGLDAGGFGECFAGNRADAVFAQARKATQINRETINRLTRNFDASVLFQPAKKL